MLARADTSSVGWGWRRLAAGAASFAGPLAFVQGAKHRKDEHRAGQRQPEGQELAGGDAEGRNGKRAAAFYQTDGTSATPNRPAPPSGAVRRVTITPAVPSATTTARVARMRTPKAAIAAHSTIMSAAR